MFTTTFHELLQLALSHCQVTRLGTLNASSRGANRATNGGKIPVTKLEKNGKGVIEETHDTILWGNDHLPAHSDPDYPLVIKHGWLENLLYMEILLGKSLIHARFSSKPRLMRPEGKNCGFPSQTVPVPLKIARETVDVLIKHRDCPCYQPLINIFLHQHEPISIILDHH